jgi:Secretion system C-terminal sorting domain
MKKILTIGFLLLLVYNSSYSQYVPMPVDSATWGIREITNDGLWNAYYFHLNGDTLIDNFNYSKVYDGDYLLGFMRENSKVVYFKHASEFYIECDTNEFVLYDFNLELGDTFQLPTCPYFGVEDSLYTGTVIEIDSIQLNNGSYRKRFNFSFNGPYDCGPLQWVEGIGNIGFAPFYYYLDCFERYYTFVCFKIEEEEIYGDCSTLSNNEIESDKIKIFPNPAFNKIYIEGLDSYYKYSIMIFDMNGKIVLESIQNQGDIDISSLNHGIYICQIQVGKNKIVKKIIKL